MRTVRVHVARVTGPTLPHVFNAQMMSGFASNTAEEAASHMWNDYNVHFQRSCTQLRQLCCVTLLNLKHLVSAVIVQLKCCHSILLFQMSSISSFLWTQLTPWVSPAAAAKFHLVSFTKLCSVRHVTSKRDQTKSAKIIKTSKLWTIMKVQRTFKQGNYWFLHLYIKEFDNFEIYVTLM
jgi:hypothetical protein